MKGETPEMILYLQLFYYALNVFVTNIYNNIFKKDV